MPGLSCNSNLLSDMPVERAMDVLVEYGYDAIDICLEIAPPFVPIPTPHMSPSDNDARRSQVRRHAEKAGIAIAAVNAHSNLSPRDPERRAENTKFVQGAVQLAADLGAKTVVSVAGVKDAYGYEQWYFDWGIQSLREIVPIADRLGVTIAIEAGSPPGCLVYNLRTMQQLLAAEGLDSVRVLFDPAHYQIRGDSPVDAFLALQDKVVHVHAKDAAGDPENIIFPPLGEGEIDFEQLAAAMAKTGYAGYLAMEYEAFAWDFPKDYRQVLPAMKAFLDDLVSRHWS
jgi:inosose dehydratase